MGLPRIIDNERRGFADVLQDISTRHDCLSIATGYWDLPGTELIFDKIKGYKSVRLLIGQEPLIPRHRNKLRLDTVTPETEFPDKDISFDLEQLEHDGNYRGLISRIKEMIDKGRLEVRVYRKSFLHAKCYIFGDYANQEAVGIIGSSNFTKAGLTANTELNTLEPDARIVKYKPSSDSDEYGHLSWFDYVWNDEQTESWDHRFKEILEYSPVGDMTYSPYEMYIKTLWEIYEDDVLDDKRISKATKDPLHDFQAENAELLVKKLDEHKVAMLADSVGLGKTITAGVVLKHYEDKGARRTYVIAPSSLCDQWKNELAKHLRLFGVEVLSMQNLTAVKNAAEIDKYAEVDLFIVDEAHNLRSDTGQRHKHFLDWFSKNPNSKVLLLTATPINNHLTDLSHQIQLALKGKLRYFPVIYPTPNKNENIDFFEAVARLSRDIKKAEKSGQKPDFDKVQRVMHQGLRRFLVRTTRQGIEKQGGLFHGDSRQQSFPTGHVEGVPYTFSPNLNQDVQALIQRNKTAFGNRDVRNLSIESLLDQTQQTRHPLDIIEDVKNEVTEPNVFINTFQIMQLLGFVPYRSMVYRHQFYAKTIDEIKDIKLPDKVAFQLRSQMSIHNMLHITLLKRLESSAYALKLSLERYQNRLEMFEHKLGEGFICALKDIQISKNDFGDDLEAVFAHDKTKDDEGQPYKLERADEKKYNLGALRADILRDKKILASFLIFVSKWKAKMPSWRLLLST